MPVDDKLLEDKVQELYNKISILNKHRKEFEGIMISLQNIRKYEEKIYETDDDGNTITRIIIAD